MLRWLALFTARWALVMPTLTADSVSRLEVTVVVVVVTTLCVCVSVVMVTLLKVVVVVMVGGLRPVIHYPLGQQQGGGPWGMCCVAGT